MTLTIQYTKWPNNDICLFLSKQTRGRAFLNPFLAEIQVSDRLVILAWRRSFVQLARNMQLFWSWHTSIDASREVQ